MAKRDVSPKMQAVYDARKEETLKKVQSAIDQLQANGEKVTKKRLAEVSGLSSGTFSKEHVKELLKENQVCQYAPGAKEHTNFYVAARPTSKPSKPHEHLTIRNTLQEKQFSQEDEDRIIEAQKKIIAKLEKKQENLENQIQEIEKQYERMLGQYQLAARILNNMGVKIDNDQE